MFFVVRYRKILDISSGLILFQRHFLEGLYRPGGGGGVGERRGVGVCVRDKE